MGDPRVERPADNRRLLRVRDLIDRGYAVALDIEALASAAHPSRAHFIRSGRPRRGLG